MKKLFIINANSGDKDKNKLIENIKKVYESHSRQDYEIFISQSARESKKVIEDFEKEDEKGIVYVCGGDGTLRGVCECFINKDLNLGLIPTGTGNDFAKLFDYSNFKIEDTFEPRIGKIDAYSVNNITGVNVFSLGFDTIVLANSYRVRGKFKNSGKFSYYIGALMSIGNFKPVSMKITFDSDREIEGDFLISAVCNGSYYGSGFYPGVNAKLDDGLLNLVLVDTPPLYKLGVIAKYRNGKIFETGYAKEVLFKKAVIDTKKAVLANVDGSIFQDKHFEMEIFDKAINWAYFN